MTSKTTQELRLDVEQAKINLHSHVQHYGFDESNPVQFELENKLAEARAALYDDTGEITLSNDE